MNEELKELLNALETLIAMVDLQVESMQSDIKRLCELMDETINQAADESYDLARRLIDGSTDDDMQYIIDNSELPPDIKGMVLGNYIILRGGASFAFNDDTKEVADQINNYIAYHLEDGKECELCSVSIDDLTDTEKAELLGAVAQVIKSNEVRDAQAAE